MVLMQGEAHVIEMVRPQVKVNEAGVWQQGEGEGYVSLTQLEMDYEVVKGLGLAPMA